MDLLVQEGIFDATSYGFRRLKYQMSSSKKKKSISDDPFFNPQEVKKEHYFVSTWDNPLIINKYFIFYYDDCAVAHLSIKKLKNLQTKTTLLKIFSHASNFLNTNTALCPPNPKLLLIA